MYEAGMKIKKIIKFIDLIKKPQPEEESKEQREYHCMIDSRFSMNSNNFKNFGRLKLKIKDASNKMFLNSFLETSFQPFQLKKCIVSSSFTFYGKNLFLAFLTDPHSIFSPRDQGFTRFSSLNSQKIQESQRSDNSGAEDETLLKNSWLILTWKAIHGNYKNLYLNLIGDLQRKEAILAALFHWKVCEIFSLTHCITSQYEIQNQINYQLNEMIQFSYGMKIKMETKGIRRNFVGMGLHVNI